MIRRFFLGLFEGLLIGVGAGVVAARGLGLALPNALTAALLAALVGLVVGMVAGRPIWAKGAKIEAALKAGAGAFAAAALSFALGKWLHAPVDLSELSLGVGPVGQLSAVSLPAIACALALFFELDDDNSKGSGAPLRRVSSEARVTSEGADPSEAAELDAAVGDDALERRFEKR